MIVPEVLSNACHTSKSTILGQLVAFTFKLALRIRSTRAGGSVVLAVLSTTPTDRSEVPTFRGPDNTLYRGVSLVYRTASERRKNLLPGLFFSY